MVRNWKVLSFFSIAGAGVNQGCSFEEKILKRKGGPSK
jgi:hypothetical protein